MNRLQKIDLAACLAIAVVFGLTPFFTRNEGVLFLICLVMVWSVFALGFDVAFGMSGILSFGHAAYFGLGAYGAVWAMLNLGLPFSVSLVVAAASGAAAALVVGIIGSRLSGLHFSLLTLMLAQFAAILMLTRLRGLSGGVDGLPGVPRPRFGSIDFSNNANFYWVILLVFVGAILLMHVLKKSPLGQALQGMRQNAVRAEQLGLNVARLRLAAFGMSGALSGVAGALLASLMMYASPQMLHWKVSGDVLIMTLLGGSGMLLGPIVGVAFFEILKEVLASYSDYWYGMVGIVFILSTIFLPRGIAGLLLRLGGPR